jgi:hypothetical protein
MSRSRTPSPRVGLPFPLDELVLLQPMKCHNIVAAARSASNETFSSLISIVDDVTLREFASRYESLIYGDIKDIVMREVYRRWLESS